MSLFIIQPFMSTNPNTTMWCRLKYHLFSVKLVMMENPYNNSFQDVIKFAMVDRNIPEMSSLCIESTIYVKKLSLAKTAFWP